MVVDVYSHNCNSAYLEELAVSLIRSYDGKKFDKQELLNHWLPPPEREEKRYTQDWPLYNAAQTKEKLLFLKLLDDATESIREPAALTSNGRPAEDRYDIAKALAIKSWSNLSSRRTIAELQITKQLGYIDAVPHFNTLTNYLRDPVITLILHRLYPALAEPVKQIETHFAPDGTGFSVSSRKHWVDVRLEKSEQRDFCKLHAMCGVRTHVVARALVSEGTCNDSPLYGELLTETAKIFTVREVSADAGYLSRQNVQLTADAGAKPYIHPKKNTRPVAKGHYPAWNNMIWLWRTHQAAFLQAYHQRSNVESGFSSIKRKFGSSVRSKDFIGQQNEVLLKVVCHNASMLTHALLQFNISPQSLLSAQKPALSRIL